MEARNANRPRQIDGGGMQVTFRDVLVVIDVQNDFCTGGALAVADGEGVIPLIHALATSFAHVIVTQDWHPPQHHSFAGSHCGKQPFQTINDRHGKQTLWPDHCVQGTWGAELHPALMLPQAELILRKGCHPDIDSYSVFFENDRTTPTGLFGYVQERQLERVFLAGLAYDYCVGYSALDARRLGLPAIILRDSCRAIDLDDSVCKMEAHFARSGVALIESTDLINS